MAKKKKNDEKFMLTFKGLMYVIVGDKYERALDDIELNMRRLGCNAIVLDDGFHFADVERCEDE